jgi:MYXO-CTERM domain-containing protein
LPDDGRFPADARHPDVVLHFSNDAPAASQQTHYVRGAGRFSFAVPPATYAKMFLFVTSSEGSSSLRVGMMYADTTDVITVTVPDYYVDVPPNDPVVFNLASNLPKWNQQNNVAEANHHNLTGLEMHPIAGKTLSGITVEKTAPGYLVFWGATGIATGSGLDAGTGVPDASAGDAEVDAGGSDVVEGGGGGGSAGGGAGATGSGGEAGSGGAAGASGSGSMGVGRGGSGGAAGSGRMPEPGASEAGCACRSRGGAKGPSRLAGLVVLLAAFARRRVRGS